MMLDENISDLDASEEQSNGRKKRQSSSTSTIELMVYVDAGVQNDASQNGFSVVEYILGIINIVSTWQLYSYVLYVLISFHDWLLTINGS